MRWRGISPGCGFFSTGGSRGGWSIMRGGIEAGAHYHPRFGMEFGSDVLLTAQGAPSLMHWRGVPLMKTVFDYALYPMLLAELKPRTIFEIGSGLGASAVWFADHLKMLGIGGHVHSIDINAAGAGTSRRHVPSRRLCIAG